MSGRLSQKSLTQTWLVKSGFSIKTKLNHWLVTNSSMQCMKERVVWVSISNMTSSTTWYGYIVTRPCGMATLSPLQHSYGIRNIIYIYISFKNYTQNISYHLYNIYLQAQRTYINQQCKTIAHFDHAITKIQTNTNSAKIIYSNFVAELTLIYKEYIYNFKDQHYLP